MITLYRCGCSAVGGDALPDYCPEHAANARLIAAAPEMLAAIKACVDQCEAAFRVLDMKGPDRKRMGVVWFDIYERLADLLAKIEGQS